MFIDSTVYRLGPGMVTMCLNTPHVCLSVILILVITMMVILDGSDFAKMWMFARHACTVREERL